MKPVIVLVVAAVVLFGALIRSRLAESQVTPVVLRPNEIPKNAWVPFVRSGSSQPLQLNNPGVDPGVRSGTLGVGALLSGLSQAEQNLAADAMFWFQVPWSVTAGSDINNSNSVAGLGPGFDSRGCSDCHASPVPGGSSPALNSQLMLATYMGAHNVAPGFISANSGHTPTVLPWRPSTGGAEPLYTIAGRSDAGSCAYAEPDWATIVANNDVTFTSPVPLFGEGLIESTPSANFIADQVVIPSGATWTFAGLGITTGIFSMGAGGVQTIGRKASAPSLDYFSGLALTLDVGISNRLFPRKAQNIANCVPNPQPEDGYRTTRLVPNSSSVQGDYLQLQELYAAAMRYLAPPTPASAGYTAGSTTVTAAQISDGQTQFINVGCVACHTQSHTTGPSTTMTGQSNVTYSPWSDFALHDMGPGLSNRITLGAAGPTVWKTAALWGIGQRTYFLHDGRTTDMNQAIQAHGGEGTNSLALYNALSTTEQQNVIYFLRSL